MAIPAAGAAVTTKLTDYVSLSVSVAARYDRRPAPLPTFGASRSPPGSRRWRR